MAGVKPVDAQAQALVIADWTAEAPDDAVRQLGEEALLGTNDTVSIEFFERALAAALPVGRINVIGGGEGTGFFVGEGILVTNHHVLTDQESAERAAIVMNLEESRIGPAKPQDEFALDPGRFFYTSKELNVTFVAAKGKSDRGTDVGGFQELPLIRGEGKIVIGGNTNVIQHPSGGNKMVAFRHGVLVKLTNTGVRDEFCYYTSDTDKEVPARRHSTIHGKSSPSITAPCPRSM